MIKGSREVFAGDLWTGSAALLSLCGAVGAAGGLVAAANIAPEECAAAFSGDGPAQVRVAALDRAASVDFPAGYKRATAERFGVSPSARVGG